MSKLSDVVEARIRAVARATRAAKMPDTSELTVERMVKLIARLGFRADVVMWRAEPVDEALPVEDWVVLGEVAAALPHMPRVAREGVKALVRPWRQT